MYKVAFTMRDMVYSYGEIKYEIYFKSEIDAYNFFNDLENFVNKKTGGNSYVICKSTPEEVNPIQLYRYDLELKNLVVD